MSDLINNSTEAVNEKLLQCVKENDLNGVKKAVENGADIETKKDIYGWTALILATKNGRLEIVKYLIDQKADIEAKDNDGWTALILAANNGHLEIVKF